MATINSGNSTTLYSTTQTTTSVSTATNLPAPQVNETNFTTLYSNSSAAATGGGTSGNLLVSGNLRVLGTSDLEGAVTIGNSYILPTSDGTTGQLITTDGNGNLTFQNVSSISSYAIQADTATGGANLTLVGTSTTDSVKFAEGTNIGIVRTDANTITISTVADNIPDGTARGEVLYWDGTAWTANNVISSAVAADRFVLEYENSTAGVNSIAFLRKNYGATAYTTGDGTALGFQLDSNSQALNLFATVAASWDASAPTISLNTNINNNTTGPFVTAATFTTAQATLPGDLAVNGGDITTTQTTGNLFNTTATTVNVGNGADTELNLGSPTGGSKVVIKPETLVGISTTQNVFDTVATTVNAFGAATTLDIGAATGLTTINNDTKIDGTAYVESDLTVNNGTVKTNSGNVLLFDTTATTIDAFRAATAITMGVDGAVAGAGTTTIRSAFTVVKGDLAVNGDNTGSSADITTTKTIASLFNTTATTINIGNGADTEVNIGSPTGGSKVVIKPETIVGINATQAVFDTVATTVNAFGAATAVNIGAATGTTTIEHDLTVQGGNINLNGTATAGVMPFITFATQADGVNSMYGIRGKSTVDDPWFVGAGSTGDDQGYLEIATGDNAGDPSNNASPIYARQYNGYATGGVPWYGGGGVVVNEFTLLDINGDTSIPNNLTVGDDITLNSDKANVNVNLNFGRVAPSTNAVIRWNSSTNIFEWSEDGTTWHQFIDATLTAPFYNGQMLTYRINSSAVGEWINDNRVTTTDANERNVFEYRPLSPSAGVNSSLFLRKNYSDSVEGTPGVGTYADGAGTSVSFQVDSDSQGSATYANVTGVYSSTFPTVSLRTSINNGTNFTPVGDFTTVNASIPGSLTIESRSDIDTAPLTTTAITQVPLITSTRNVMKAVVYIVQGTDVHTVEALVLRTGASTAMVTTYAEMYNTSSLAAFAADTSGGAIRLLVTPANATSMLFTSVITSLT